MPHVAIRVLVLIIAHVYATLRRILRVLVPPPVAFTLQSNMGPPEQSVAEWLDQQLVAEFHAAGLYLPEERLALEAKPHRLGDASYSEIRRRYADYRIGRAGRVW